MHSYTNIPSAITSVNSISKAIANPRQGDWIFFDVDKLFLNTGNDRFNDRARLTEASLATDIKFLREVGVKVIGLTASKDRLSSETREQLAAIGIELDEVLHSPTKGEAAKKFLLEQAELVTKPKRIYAFDDVAANLKDIQTALQDIGIPFYGKHYVPAQYQPIQINADTNKVFPCNLDGYKVVRPLGGGSQSVFELQHEVSGNRLVIKFGTHEDSAKLEILSNAVYHAMGVAVPKMRVYHTLPKDLATKLGLKSPYGMFKVCEYIGNDQGNQAQEKVIKDAASRNFVAHVLMGNIDVAKSDNFIVSTDGAAHLIDAGANFIFRSMGKPREEKPEFASEIDSLRNKKINPAGAAWFAAIDDKEIARQIREINVRIREIADTVWQVSNELELTEELRQRFIELLSDRLDILTTRFSGEVQAYAKTDKKAQADQTAAGVLSYTMIDNVPHVLLSKRVRHEWWDNFGGKSDAEDKYLVDTARREVKEESNGLLEYPEYKLAAGPCHDIITGKRERQFVYRMYIAEHEYVNPAGFNDHEHTQHQWVPVSDIVRAVKSKEVKLLEDQQVKVVQTDSGDIPLFPPLCHMLEQQPVLEQLEKLCHSRRLKRRCTLSYAEEQNAGENNSYRPLTTVYKKRQDLAVNMLKKNDVLKQIKRERKTEEDQNPTKLKQNKTDNSLSPSELHIAAVLGDEYVANNVLANVELMISRHFNTNIPADKKQELIQNCASMIETEKDNPDRFHFYHGCNSAIAFAYDVYSALYQEIYANEARRAFRIDTTHLKKFNNIIDFIAYYSKGGTEDISNNNVDYHECAISTNVFLFGNHSIDSSCSVDYMLNNTVARDFKIENMLLQLFKPFHVSPEWVKRLQNLYVKYAQARKGTLYQIGVAKDHVRSMSYPAGTGGVLNKLGEDADIISIVSTLTNEVQVREHSKASVQYIKNLQARLLASPGLEMNVQQIRITDAHHEQDMQFAAGLRQLIGELMYQSHLHAHMGNPADERGVYRFYPHILQQNQIPHQKGLTDERLASMIFANDAARVREVITDNPEILKREVSVQLNNYINGYHSREIKFSVLELILIKSGMNAAELGSDFENAALNYTADSTSEFINVMRKISPENRSVFVIKRIDNLQYDLLDNYWGETDECSIENLATILELLPEKDRLNIYERFADRIQPFEHENIIKVFELLPDQFRIAFYENNKKDITTCERLRTTLGILPTGERLAALALYEHLIDATTADSHDSRDAFVHIIGLLPENAKLDVALRHQQLIRNSLTLRNLLQAMDPVSCSRFLTTYRKYIDTDFIIDILQCLPESERYAFSLKHHSDLNGYCSSVPFTSVMEILPESDRYNFFMHYEDHLNSHNLFKVLLLLPENYHLTILKKCYTSCVNRVSPCEIKGIAYNINCLPSSIKALYSQYVRETISDSYTGKLSQGKRLAYALHFTPEIERMNLVKQFEASITTRNTLVNVGEMLEHNDYLWLVNRHLDLIRHGADLYHVTLQMAPKSRLNFLLPLVGRLNVKTWKLDYDDEMYAQLSHILELLSNPNEQEVLLREYLKFPVCSNHNLLHALPLLPEEERFDCLMKNLSGVASHYNLPKLVEHVPENKKMDFYRAYAAVTTNQQNFFEILQLLPKEERAAAIVNTQIKFKFKIKLHGHDHENIISFVTLLPKQDQAMFLHSIIPDDRDVLETLLQLLPVNDRLHCAIKYIALVKNGISLGRILDKLESDEDKLTLISHVKDNIASESIQKYVESFVAELPESGKCAFIAMQRKTDDSFTSSHLSKKGLFARSVDRDHHDTNIVEKNLSSETTIPHQRLSDALLH